MYKFRPIIIFLCISILVGCSTTGRIEELVISSTDEIEPIIHHSADVSVKVIGGDRRFVGSDIFRDALIQSLEKTQIFLSASEIKNTAYELFVVILRSENSGLGGTYIIDSKWILFDNDKEIWTETINGTGSSRAFGGVARIRASAERASKDTIRNGIKVLGGLTL